MKKTNQRVSGVIAAVLGAVLLIGAILFKLAARFAGIQPDGPKGWAIHLSTGQLIVALCLIAVGVVILVQSGRQPSPQPPPK